MNTAVILHYITDAGRHYTDILILPGELCIPRCLVTAAITAGAVFAVCPAKYGCRQFVNPAFVRNEE